MAPRIIGLTGKKGSGKSTAAMYLRERHGYAGSNLTDPMDEMLTPLLRRMKVPEHEIALRLSGSMKDDAIPGFEWLSGRKLKQAIGLEFRDAVSKPRQDGGTDRGLFHDLWMIDNVQHPKMVHEQVRYGFEADLIRRDGGVVYKITDPDGPNDDDHESERIDFQVDGEIVNPKTGTAPLHLALDAIVGDGPSQVIDRSQDESPLAAFDADIDRAMNEHGAEIRRIADRADNGDDDLSSVLDDIASDIKGRLGSDAANLATDEQAEYAIDAAANWVTNTISNSTTDRRVAAVYAFLGAENAEQILSKEA